MKSIFGDNGGGLWGATKKVASTAGSGAKGLGKSSRMGISSAKETVVGAVAPTSAKVDIFYPTQEGVEYLEELQEKGQVTNEDHWAFQMLSPAYQTSRAFVNRMMAEHNYTGTKNQLVKNVNYMLENGFISATPPNDGLVDVNPICVVAAASIKSPAPAWS